MQFFPSEGLMQMIKPLHYLRFRSIVLLLGLNTIEMNTVLNIAIIKGGKEKVLTWPFCLQKQKQMRDPHILYMICNIECPFEKWRAKGDLFTSTFHLTLYSIITFWVNVLESADSGQDQDLSNKWSPVILLCKLSYRRLYRSNVVLENPFLL